MEQFQRRWFPEEWVFRGKKKYCVINEMMLRMDGTFLNGPDMYVEDDDAWIYVTQSKNITKNVIIL